MTLLTIAVPTFNRLTSLSKQIDKLAEIDSPNVEILISDNASTDGTQGYLREIVGKYPNFSFLFSLTNYGFDANILKLYSNAQSSYVWFLSDDDLVNPKEVEALIMLLSRTSTLGVVALILNDWNRTTFCSPMVSYAGYGHQIQIEKNVIHSVLGSQAIRTNVGTLVSQISTCVIAKIEDLDLDFNGGGIAHVVLAQRVLLNQPRFLLFDSKAVNLGAKADISNWFMESCLNGVGVAYGQLQPILGDENCRLVVDATKILGLKIAFFSIGSRKDNFDRRLVSHFTGASSLRMRITYGFYFLLVQASLRFRLIAYLGFRCQQLYLKIIQKLKLSTDRWIG